MTTKNSPSALTRFSGSNGKSRLIFALQEQFIVGGDIDLAKAIAKKISLHEYECGQTLLEQGEPDDHLLFIFSGTVEIFVNNRQVATRAACQHIGEMSLLDTTAVRSATAKARETAIVGQISECDFTRIAKTYPNLWRRLAIDVSRRLRERNKFHQPPRSQPAIFIGSSSEGLDVASCIHKKLRNQPFVPALWSDGVFECSKTTIEELVRTANTSDFAIIVLTADDVTKSRGKTKPTPRDNVVFELGLFMGALSRERTYIVAPRGVDLTLPTDLLGLTLVRFDPSKTTSSAVGPVIKQLCRLINKLGPI